MGQKILAVNAGSSSLKFKLFEMPEEKELLSGVVDRIGGPGDGTFSYKYNGEKTEFVMDIPYHATAISKLLEELVSSGAVDDLGEIVAVGHRIVQGGEHFKSSVLATEENLDIADKLSPLAPLHNPANVLGVRAFARALPTAKQSLVFDTVFHQTMPEENYLYPIDRKFYTDYKIRRYGFHGTSHDYVTGEIAKLVKVPREEIHAIVAHLGNGASITEVINGKSVNTSMGYTPTGGLIMGTRTGDIDPTVVSTISKITNFDGDRLADVVTKESGMLAATGFSNDMRDIEAAVLDDNHEHHHDAYIAFKMFIKRIADFINIYAADIITETGGSLPHAIAFTAGIGENSSLVREHVMKRLTFLATIDSEKNNTHGTIDITHASDNKIKVFVIPTEEELMIARDAYKLANS